LSYVSPRRDRNFDKAKVRVVAQSIRVVYPEGGVSKQPIICRKGLDADRQRGRNEGRLAQIVQVSKYGIAT
jgi:hypothetical protein